ncbi:putative Decaprenylphosphoryl-beta-D-ribose oxidase [Vibrio chagasii]|nr:putative Decaprenylphosphoryl-beta-D-ribose oxidase [Vibrio chagasii]
MAIKEIMGFGRVDRASVDVRLFNKVHSLDNLKTLSSFAIRGSGMSYGDSAISDANVLCTSTFDKLVNWDADSGILALQSGVTIEKLLEFCVPLGWFPCVLAGTKKISIGGAIASDVHGKNHHNAGSFCDYVLDIELWTPDYGVLICSRDINRELFFATCGGMGLTGVILSATIQLKAISSPYMNQVTSRKEDLGSVLCALSLDAHDYSVAWLDLANSGRGVVISGDHVVHSDSLFVDRGSSISIPNWVPRMFNKLTISVFNQAYFWKPSSESFKQVHYDKFFFPLDIVDGWEGFYGQKGFRQIQFVVPEYCAQNFIEYFIRKVNDLGLKSFLTIAKRFGVGGSGLLSFPMSGYTIASDFADSDEVEVLFNDVASKIIDVGGKIYLTKDSLLGEQVFKSMYKKHGEFMELRGVYDKDGALKTRQSERLGL